MGRLLTQGRPYNIVGIEMYISDEITVCTELLGKLWTECCDHSGNNRASGTINHIEARRIVEEIESAIEGLRCEIFCHH